MLNVTIRKSSLQGLFRVLVFSLTISFLIFYRDYGLHSV